MLKLYYIISLSILTFVISDDPMNYIIDNIYLGDSVAAADEDYLKDHNISAVVNCAEDLTSNYKDLKFIELNLFDNELQSLFPKFDVAYKFIKLHSQANILIHCVVGMSRSASLVVFYLMKEKGWDYDTCLAYMKERRPIVCPNEGFEKKLKKYYDKYIKK